jgi:hypothetical protein
MSIPPINPIPSHGGGQPAEARTARAAEGVVRHHTAESLDTTNVVVEMPTTNTVVYKIVDTSTGQLIEQIPSQAMLNFANAVDQALPSLRKQEE